MCVCYNRFMKTDVKGMLVLFSRMEDLREPLLRQRNRSSIGTYRGLMVVLFFVFIALAFVITQNVHTEYGLVKFRKPDLEVLLCLYMAIPVIALAIYFKKAEEPILLRREDTDDDAFDSNEYLLGSVYIFGSGTMFLRIQQLFSYSYCLPSSSSLIYAIFSFIFTALQMCFIHAFLAQRLAYHWVLKLSLYFVISANISTYITYIPDIMRFKTNDDDGNCLEHVIPKMLHGLKPYLVLLTSEFCIVSSVVIVIIIQNMQHPDTGARTTTEVSTRSTPIESRAQFPHSTLRRTPFSNTETNDNLVNSIATSALIEDGTSRSARCIEHARSRGVGNRIANETGITMERNPNVPMPFGLILGIIFALLLTVSSLCCKKIGEKLENENNFILSLYYYFFMTVNILEMIACYKLKKHAPPSQRSSVSSLLVDALLIVSVSAIVIWEFLVIIASVAYFKVRNQRSLSILSFLCRVTSLIAAVFLARVLIQYQNSSVKLHIQNLKQYFMFLTITNIRYWVVDSSIENNSSAAVPLANKYYGEDLWRYIQAFVFLWATLFRFCSGLISFHIIKTKFV